jgi:hypothetical protein
MSTVELVPSLEPLLEFPALEVPVEFMRFCYQCNSVHVFVADRVCASGLVGICSECGDERVVAFTRTTVEEAA